MSAQSDTEGSSDEAVPLSRVVEVDAKSVDNDDHVMGVPNIIILTRGNRIESLYFQVNWLIYIYMYLKV